MNKIKLACLATCLIGGIAQASTPCDGFEINVQNKLADNLLVTTIKLNGADLQPGGIQKIDAGSKQAFTVNKSTDGVPMKGTLVFHTLSVPSKEVKINFDLDNSGLVCQHTDTSPDSDYSVEKTRLPGKADYTISNK
jgi:hypothetical protein